MATPHINAERGDFANVVLMPGDPLRAKWMAETFLHDYKMVTNVRNIYGYTGYTKNGKRISIMASGMGHPSIGIYSYELYTQYDVDTIIRVGTCGGYQDKIDFFDVILATTSCTDSNWFSQYGLSQFSPAADFELLYTAYNEAKAMGKKVHAGTVLSADVFYDDDPNNWQKWARMGVLVVEMESYALYCNAERLGKRALAVLTCTDHYTKKNNMVTAEMRQTGLTEMMEIAIATAEKFANE